VDRPDKPSDLSVAAFALDRELRRFADLADQAGRLKLNTEKNLERATRRLTRAAESQDRINAHVQQLLAAVSVTRRKQESDGRGYYKTLHLKMTHYGIEAREFRAS